MTRIVKLAAAGIGAATAVAAAVVVHPRSGIRRRRVSAPIAMEQTQVLVGERRRTRRRVGDSVETAVRLALQAAYGEAAEAILVKAERGVVTLRGEVDAIDDIGRYETTARAVPGVTDVDNLLRVRLVGVARPYVLSA